MHDFDFYAESGEVSRYSWHENYLDKDFAAFAQVLYSQPFRGGAFAVQFGLRVQYAVQKWSAYNGYIQYPAEGQAWTGSEERRTVWGNVVSYERSVLTGSVVFRVPVVVEVDGLVAFELALSPALVFARTLDNHYLRQKQFADTMRGQFALSFCSTGYYRHFVFCAGFSLNPLATGTSASGAIGTTGTPTEDSAVYSGTRSWSWFVGAGVRL